MKRYGARHITLTADLKQSVNRALQPLGVLFAYMFGSSITGRLRDESDIDIAVYFDPALSAREQYRQLKTLYGLLVQALTVPVEALDLTLLNRAPLLLQHVARTEGTILYERDHDARVEFEMDVMRRRDDEQYYRRAATDAFLARRASSAV